MGELQIQQQLVCIPDASPQCGSEKMKLPLSLFLSPKIPQSRALALQEAAHTRQSYVRVVSKEEGAILVLPSFEPEEISALELKRCRIIGLRFAERLIRDVSSLEKVPALPLFDFILPPRLTSVTCSGLPPPKKMRCQVLARWMGAVSSEELDLESGVLISARVSLNPKSKYQKAVAHQLPIVRTSFLEASWAAKERVNMELYALPALEGLGVWIDPRYQDEIADYKKKILDHGGVMESLDRAEVVIVKDVFAPLYEDAKKIGLLCAPPLWLDRCFEMRMCVPITKELEVRNPTSSSLLDFSEGHASESECHLALHGCVLCLCYLLAGSERNRAKALGWKCGAWTTSDPLDRAITHVIFKDISKAAVSVSMPVDEDRMYFLGMSWLEKCAREGKRVSEQLSPQQLVHYNPVCDMPHIAIVSSSTSKERVAASGANSQGPQKLEIQPVRVHPPIADAPQQSGCASGLSKPCVALAAIGRGVFDGLKLGILAARTHSNEEREQTISEKVRAHGATAIRGTIEAIVDATVDFVIVDAFGCKPAEIPNQLAPQLVTCSWLEACIADKAKHPPSSFPHFQPCRGPLPVVDMTSCSLRLTAVEVHQGQRKRALLEELAQLVGARVVDNKAKWSEITHMVCIVPELVDPLQYENASKRKKPMVKVQWLFDCYKMSSRQPEEKYELKLPSRFPEDSPAAKSSTTIFAVLDGYEVFISPCVLGSDDKLPGKAEELGAKVHTWRDTEELKLALSSRGFHREAANGIEDKGSHPQAAARNCNSRKVAVLVEKEEVSVEHCALATCMSELAATWRSIFVLPSWLNETFSQRRSLPLEPFIALPPVDSEQALKRQRTGEGMYAWQSAASTRLTELAEDSRLRALQVKQQQKLSEGIRLADLRREAPSAASRN